jgi:hypothetical protein
MIYLMQLYMQVGVLDIRLSGPAGGQAGGRKTGRGRLVEERTETGSATETKSSSQQVARC